MVITMKKISFAQDSNWRETLVHAYSYRFTDTPEFTQHEDHIANKADERGPMGYEYIAVMTKEQYGFGTTVSTRTAFEGDGAPMIVLADKMYVDDAGVVRYGEYFEVVLYKNGVNVWQMWNIKGEVTWKKRLGLRFDVTEGDIHDLSVTVTEDFLTLRVDGREAELYIPDMYRSFHVGVDACEGPNRFYDMTIEGKNVKCFGEM